MVTKALDFRDLKQRSINILFEMDLGVMFADKWKFCYILFLGNLKYVLFG